MRNIALVSLLVVASCGDDAGYSSPEQFCTAYLDAVSGKLASCEGASEEAGDKFLGLSDSKICDRVAKGAVAKRATYDKGQSEACVKLVRDTPCDDLETLFRGVGHACDKTIVGTVPPAGTCYDDFECTGDSTCSMAAGACPGVCKARVAAGGAGCQDNEDCVLGTNCVGGTCLTQAASGEPCDGRTAIPCKEGLYCQGGTALQTGTCLARQTSGQCANDQVCAKKHGCSGRTATALGVCTAAKVARTACTPGNDECAWLSSCAGAGTAATCTDWPGPGSPCGVINGETVLCLGGWCDVVVGSSMGTCKVYRAVGEACVDTGYATPCGGAFGNKCVGGVCRAPCAP